MRLWPQGLLLLAWLAFGGEAARADANYEPYTFRLFAGSSGWFGYSDGTGSAARFNNPTGAAVDSSGNVYVADFGNNTIRKGWVTPLVLTIAPDGSGGFFLRIQGTANLSYQLLGAQTLNGPWTTNAVQTAPGTGLVEFHDTSPLPGQAFYRAFQE